MPELPEVETVRRDLDRYVAGRTVETVVVTGRRTVRRQSPAELVERLEGRRVERVGRYGKYLLASLDDRAVLVIHLRMSGQLLLTLPGEKVETLPHTHVVFRLDDGAELRFVDPRTFGELFVTAQLEADGRPSALAELGIDPFLDELTPAVLAVLLRRRRTSLKAFLLDQRLLAGVGNLYADEICFRAAVRPDRRTESVGGAEVARLCAATQAVLFEAVELRGSTLRDARYCDLRGGHGAFQDRHAVYARAGAPCPLCGAAIVRMTVAGRSAHFCATCQS